MSAGSPDDRGSVGWRLYLRAQYRLLRLLDPVLRRWWQRSLPGLEPVVDLHLEGRRSGRPRRVLVTLLVVDGAWYMGHPNGESAWTRNLAASPSATLVFADGSRHGVTAVRLYAGPEREAVIRATWSQQPFPGNLVYYLARGHIRRAGAYFRLMPSSRP